jgi:hypothetical protein
LDRLDFKDELAFDNEIEAITAVQPNSLIFYG